MPGNQPILGQGGSASLGYFAGNNTSSRSGLAPSPATSTTSSQHCIGPYKNGHGAGHASLINGKINNGGFAPGHPLATNDGRRHYGSKNVLIITGRKIIRIIF